MAHDIIASHQKCMPFIIPTLLKLSDIEKYAIRYNTHLATLKNNPPKKSIDTRRAKKASLMEHVSRRKEDHLDYQTINDALIHLGEDFYIRVLGGNYKRAGQSLRFGSKGSLNVTLSGSHAGSWHSFETDEGGGPLQLLMNPTYGWGLSFPDALKEGARLSGLSLEPSMLDTKPPKHLVIKSVKSDDKSKKIARARYYFQSAEPLSNTLGERYLREHRHIDGDLSAFRFHPNIRDDRTDKDGRHHVSYHPGIVVAAQNHLGEITAVQTILLDPRTLDKVSGQAVGAVKRTRGDLKGSAVLIQSGESNKVIIAEGPETAASLMKG